MFAGRTHARSNLANRSLGIKHIRAARNAESKHTKAATELHDHRTDEHELHNLAAEQGQEQTLGEQPEVLRRVRKPGAKEEIRGDPGDPNDRMLRSGVSSIRRKKISAPSD